MKDANIKQKNKKKKNYNIKKSSLNKLKVSFADNNLLTNKINKKILLKAENERRQIKSKFSNKLEHHKDKEVNDINKSDKEDNNKKLLPFNSDKKLFRNSVFKDLITKILEINNAESSLKNNSSNVLFYQKDEAISNNINTIRPNVISFNNNSNITESKEESKTSGKKNENNKIQETSPQIKNKNTKKDISKNKNNINAVYKSGSHSGSQDYRKYSNIKSDSSNSCIAHQSENEYKYNSSIIDNFKVHLKKPDNFFGFNQISGSSSSQQLTFRVLSQKNLASISVPQQSGFKNINNNNNDKYDMLKRQKEIAQNIIDLDLNKLQKEVYEYENTDVTDAINRLPTHKFDFDNNKNMIKHFKIKNNIGKKNKKCKRNIKERFRILRRVGYVYDSLDDEEYEDQEDNNFYFEPNSNFILILDFLILITSLFNLVFIPIDLSISPFNEKNLIKDCVFVFIDIIFIIDLISGFFKAYFNFDEDLIKNSTLIIRNYLRTWFLLDFICGIPVYSILIILKNIFGNNTCRESCYFNYSGKSLYRLVELIKLLKLLKVFNDNNAKKKIKHKIKKINFFYNWGDFIKQVFKFISILNLSSCLFIFSARNSYPNWILHLNMNIHNFIPIYVCSCYYIITTVTTVGYGDIEIFSMTERIFEILFLIIGTGLYSWLLTSTSNYIKKMNEKNIKFEQKKDILDDIRTNYPLMSQDLYSKIFKLLYYKKYHKDVDKNVIINSLPYSIRNTLLTQMYNPIISNFKFFRYFENSEFIIEIVSVLKPLVGMKGDLLINEGDYVEDIIFNRSGILSLEISIDLNNPDEFIKQYIIKYNLENVKNFKNLESNNEFNSTFRNNSINSNYSKNSVNFNKINNSTFKSINNMNSFTSIKHEGYTLGREEIIKKNLQNLKILNIRKKEHFGDVLMFLNEPSPLNVRVNSKTAEVFLLCKTDVVEISSNFPNIWKRMNESSIFNLEQIRTLIMRKLSIFCFANGIKIKSLSYKKDTKTGQNKTQYSLMPIPNPNRENILNLNLNFNENNDKNSKDSEINSSQSFENFKKKNTFIIKEEQSSEESRTNSIMAKESKYYYENSIKPRKGILKKTNDNIKIPKPKEYASDDNIRRKRNKYYCQNIQEDPDQSFSHSKSYYSCRKKSSAITNKYTKSSVKKNRTKTYMKLGNVFIDENNPSNLCNNPINNIYDNSAISIPKKVKICPNFADKSKMNKKLISIPSFNFMQNNNNGLNCELDDINDEIYSNENFEINIPDNDQNLIINKNVESQDNNTITNRPESRKKFSTYDKKNSPTNTIREKEKHTDVSNNLISKNKFSNLIISSTSSLEIKSSYDNINEFTNYRFISNNILIRKTQIFLSKQCNFLYNTNTKLPNMPYHSPINRRTKKPKSTIKDSKYFYNKKFSDCNNNIHLLHSPQTFSKELSKLEFLKTKKDNEKLLENPIKDIKVLNNDILKNSTIKGENELSKRGNAKRTNMFNSLSPKKLKRKVDISFDSSISIKTKNKLDTIMKNMKRDNQNLNNPNEFYADLFNNFYRKKIRKNESQPIIPKVKVLQIDKVKDSSDESDEEEKEEYKKNSLEDS